MTMEFLDIAYKIILIVHIAAGMSAIFTGGMAIASKKGGKLHKRVGKWFYYGMVIAGLTGIVASLKINSGFLLSVAIFTLYGTWAGNRSATRRKGEAKYLQILDKTFTILAFPVGGFLIYIAIKAILGGNPGLGSIPMVFGILVVMAGISDFKERFQGKTKSKKEAILDHIGQMGGAYIATITAFLANNVQIDPQFIVWLLPTAIGTPYLILTTRKWRKKFFPNGMPSSQAQKTIPETAG